MERLRRVTNSETAEGVTIIQLRIYVKATLRPTEFNKVPVEQISSIILSTIARNICKKCHGSMVLNSSQIAKATKQMAPHRIWQKRTLARDKSWTSDPAKDRIDDCSCLYYIGCTDHGAKHITYTRQQQ